MYKYHSRTTYLCIKIIILHCLIMAQFYAYVRIWVMEQEQELQVEPALVEDNINISSWERQAPVLSTNFFDFYFTSLL
jgi:hypothetical protein